MKGSMMRGTTRKQADRRGRYLGLVLAACVAITGCALQTGVVSPVADLGVVTVGLPASVPFRTRVASFNRQYEFVIHRERIFFRHREESSGIQQPWKLLPVHPAMGRPAELSADDENLMVVDEAGRIFTMFKGLEEDTAAFRWTDRWGHPFWYGPGIQLPPDALAWDASFMSPAEDKYWLAPNGNRHDVGQGCTNVFVLRGDGQRVTYLDPWLPADSSYELATPQRGRFVARTMSASGSTILLVGHHGEVFTVNFDFDQIGADTLFFRYSYRPEDWKTDLVDEVVPRAVSRPLPIPEWRRHAAPPGPFTDRTTLFKVGEGGIHRTLRIEGMNDQGQTGYWTKDITEDDWSFARTDLPLLGTRLDGQQADALVKLHNDCVQVHLLPVVGGPIASDTLITV